ncbi:MAG TPA: hypothetical protein PKU91_08980, partial [Phycisphaerales bacterium]|nr:hypothetical protein [Phycisphaerales bacterium]
GILEDPLRLPINAQAVGEGLLAIAHGAAGGGAMFRFDGKIPLWATATLALLTCFFRIFRYAGGAFMLARRSAFEAAGGWDQTFYAGEEIALARSLKRHGRFVIIRTRVVTSGRKLRAFEGAELLRMTLAMVLSPRRAVRSRERLPLWYGPRRADPADQDTGAGMAARPP